MNIVCSSDENYLDYCLLMLKSLIKHHPKDLINIYILHSNISSKRIIEFRRKITSGNITIEFCEIKNDIFKNAPVSYHLTIATYYRILMTEILPKEINKVLYFDCDILIRKPLDELWNIDLKSYPLTAAIAAGMHDYSKEIGLNKDSLYFNAGIMLVNLQYWRVNDIYYKCLKILETHHKIIQWWDQDILNIVFEGKWLPIDFTWNSQPYLYEDIKSEGPEILNLYNIYNYQCAIKDPHIVHYAGGSKPWHFNETLPFFYDYLPYLKNGRLTFILFKLKRLASRLVNYKL